MMSASPLCEKLSEETEDFKRITGPATNKLLEALAEYRDAPPEDR